MKTSSYTYVNILIIFYNRLCGNGKNIASGLCKQGANSAELIQRIAEGDEASLWIIKWTYNGETQSNHVFTKKTTYDDMRKWVEIIGRECGFINEITELN